MLAVVTRPEREAVNDGGAHKRRHDQRIGQILMDASLSATDVRQQVRQFLGCQIPGRPSGMVEKSRLPRRWIDGFFRTIVWP